MRKLYFNFTEAIFETCHVESDNSIHCYHAIEETVTYSQARELCPSGSYLVIIESQEEMAFISNEYFSGQKLCSTQILQNDTFKMIECDVMKKKRFLRLTEEQRLVASHL